MTSTSGKGRTGVGIRVLGADWVIFSRDLKEEWVCYKAIGGPNS